MALFRLEPTAGFTAAVRPHRQGVLAARTVLAALENRLRAPEPVTARGVALLRALLTEGTSPLYRPSEPDALSRQLRGAAAALEPPADAIDHPRCPEARTHSDVALPVSVSLEEPPEQHSLGYAIHGGLHAEPRRGYGAAAGSAEKKLAEARDDARLGEAPELAQFVLGARQEALE